MVKELIRGNSCDEVSSANGFFGCELPQEDSARICEMDEDRFTQLYANPCACNRPVDFACTLHVSVQA